MQKKRVILGFRVSYRVLLGLDADALRVISPRPYPGSSNQTVRRLPVSVLLLQTSCTMT